MKTTNKQKEKSKTKQNKTKKATIYHFKGTVHMFQVYFLGLWATHLEHHLLQTPTPKLDNSHQNQLDWYIARQLRGKIGNLDFGVSFPFKCSLPAKVFHLIVPV